MNQMTNPRRINVAALLVAAAGILVIFVSAPDRFPAVPPGPLILTVAAALVAFAPGRRTPVVGLIVPLVILVGGIVTGELADLASDPENAGALIGGVIQLLAMITAVATGAVTTIAGSGGRTRSQA